MALTTDEITALQSADVPALAEIVAVYWDGDENPPTYYGSTAWDELGNFAGCPFSPVEPRLITQRLGNGAPGVHAIPLFPDVNSAPVKFRFADTDGTIRAKFADKDYRPARFELYHYWPSISPTPDLKVFGHLKRPQIYGLGSQTVDGVIGFRSPEFLVPSETHMKECSARQFGGELATAEEVAQSICPYDLHLGGTVGVNNPDTGEPWTYCLRRDKNDCVARLGSSDANKFWPGMDFEARGATVSSRFIASKGHPNDSLLRFPIQVVWGAKIIMELPVLQYYTRQDNSNANRGTVHAIVEVSNDEVDSIFNVLFNGSTSNVQSSQIRTGQRGQSPTGWTPVIANYSGRALFYGVGSTSANPGSITNASSIKFGCYVHGFKNGRVYTDAETYTTGVNNNRISALMEIYTNIRWALGYRRERIDLESWADVSNWTREPVRFTLEMQTETKTWDLSARTFFDANMQGTPAKELITDICRTGRFSVPHQRDGKYAITKLSKATTDDLNNAPVFTDAIGGNIDRAGSDSSLKFSQIDPTELKNTIVSNFEDADQNDIRRPVTCKDQDEQARAGAALGQGGFFEQKGSVVAYGVRRLEEALRFGYSVLWFGEFDQGGTRNDLKAEFATGIRRVQGLQKYQIVKIESDQNVFESPEGNPFQYFRVMDGRINEDLTVSLDCQAYNEAAYETFETVLAGGEDPPTEAGSVANFDPFELVEQISPSVAYGDGYVEVTT